MDPVSIVESRVSFGGPQAEEMPNQMEDLNERVGFFEDFVIDTNYQITDGLRMLKEDLKQIWLLCLIQKSPPSLIAKRGYFLGLNVRIRTRNGHRR